MRCHLMEGEAGCAFARAHGHVAVVVDALRASATAAYLLAAGISDLVSVRTVAEAFAARKTWPDALLFGERGGLPPEGFDGGNSPREVAAAAARRVVFATTTGVQRMAEAWGARAVFMGSPVNATAVARAAHTAADAGVAGGGADVVVIPAGLADDPAFDAQEDWVGAAVVAHALLRHDGQWRIGEGAARFGEWGARIDAEGVERLFELAPHAAKLRKAGLEADIAFCAQMDTVGSVPEAFERICGTGFDGIRVRAWHSA